MIKKAYIKPTMKVMLVQQQNIICNSNNGVNSQLQNSEVSSAWSRSNDNGWDDEEDN